MNIPWSAVFSMMMDDLFDDIFSINICNTDIISEFDTEAFKNLVTS